jgi:putative ABC transport system ATP-binding protein
MDAQPIIAVEDLAVAFPSPEGGALPVLAIEQWTLAAGAQVVIEGPSGCGKSTFINVLGGLLAPLHGRVQVAGADLGALDEAGRDRWRAAQVGLVFQSLNLLQGFTALENVLVGGSFGPRRIDAAAARSALEAVGLGPRLHHRPGELSLGEQQRVAIARALAKRPRLLLADEPTAALDPRSAIQVAELLAAACREHGCTLVLVCHQPQIAARFPLRLDFAALNRAAFAP